MATKREALIAQGIWWWTLSFSLHTLWMDPTTKILVDNPGTFTPVESKVHFLSPRYCLCWDRIPLPDAGSHSVSMCAFKMHTCTHKRRKKESIKFCDARSLMKDLLPSKLHTWCVGTVTWQLSIGENVLSSSAYLGQLLIFPLPWKKREKYCRRCRDVRLSAPFYSRPVRVHYYKPYWFPDFHLICLRDALLLTLYDLILFYWKGIVILWSCSLLWRCCKFRSFKMKSWIT